MIEGSREPLVVAEECGDLRRLGLLHSETVYSEPKGFLLASLLRATLTGHGTENVERPEASLDGHLGLLLLEEKSAPATEVREKAEHRAGLPLHARHGGSAAQSECNRRIPKYARSGITDML
jgi:hypothetical protein